MWCVVNDVPFLDMPHYACLDKKEAEKACIIIASKWVGKTFFVADLSGAFDFVYSEAKRLGIKEGKEWSSSLDGSFC